jgi:hypothetical protein
MSLSPQAINDEFTEKYNVKQQNRYCNPELFYADIARPLGTSKLIRKSNKNLSSQFTLKTNPSLVSLNNSLPDYPRLSRFTEASAYQLQE